ncbi:MAG: hypothetical protein QOF44_2857, partial [Streptomyces sp.]|nr:hypothetical protein [Streptomyces sp.]
PHRLGDGRRRRPDRAPADRAARPGRAGHPGAPRVRRDVARQPAAGPGGRGRRRAVGGAGRGGRRQLGARSGRRPGHRGRLRRHRADPGPGPAGRAGPAGPRRPAHPGARRGHLPARPARRPAPGALARPGAGRTHGGRHRAPAAHRARRGCDRGGRGRPDQRAGQPPPARRGRRGVRGPVAVLARLGRARPGAWGTRARAGLEDAGPGDAGSAWSSRSRRAPPARPGHRAGRRPASAP